MKEISGAIDRTTAISMVAVALAIDGTQGLLITSGMGVALNPVLGAAAGFLFNRWFSSYGIRLLSKDNMPLFIGTFIAELVPLFDSLPLWTGSVIITLIRHRT